MCGAAESGYMECNLRLIVMRLLSLQKCRPCQMFCIKSSKLLATITCNVSARYSSYIYKCVLEVYFASFYLLMLYCSTMLVFQNVEYRIR